RTAIVDIGTNTTRLLVAEVEARRVAREVHRESRVTRLGAGVDATGRLGEDAVAREHAVLGDYAKLIDARGADRRVAVLTSAVRDAENGQEFAAACGERYGLDVHVLSGEEEAELTYLGATDEVDPESRERTLVVDIGGGSTELILGRGPRAEFHVSTQAGVVRQGDRHLHSDPPSDGELRAVADDVRATLEAAVPVARRRSVERALAVAGTPTSLAAIAQELEPYEPERVQGYRLTAGVRDEIRRRLGEMTLDERRRVVGLHPDRAPVILPGIVILTVVMELFGLEAVEVSEHDILRGAALRFAGGAR
ncbi:MAG TPA: Ppx/GppA phosphatase family protein, partial [Solirubrobacteraceae bacterium]|nr:Ppx/GppA phosphatase family protein [Solirubrobacteraceae bacterium]